MAVCSLKTRRRTEDKISPLSVYIPRYFRDTRSLLKIALGATCLLLLYLPVFRSQVDALFHLPDFSHGFLFPPISLYIAWKRSRDLEQTPFSPVNAGLIVIVAGLMLFLLGSLASENFLMRFSFLVVLSGIVLFLMGWAHFKAYLFPIGLLIFAIPLPSILMQKITFPMQLFASRVATWTLQVLKIPVLREGNIIHLVGDTLEVAEACSGIRSLMSLIAVGTVLSYFMTQNKWHRVIMVLSSFPIAIIVNAFRVSATGVLAHHYGIGVAQGFFHGFSGAVLYFSGLIMVAAVGFALNRFNRERPEMHNP